MIKLYLEYFTPRMVDAGILVLEMTQSDVVILTVPAAGGRRRRVSFKTFRKSETRTYDICIPKEFPLVGSVSLLGQVGFITIG